MTCQDCQTATERPWHTFTAGCSGCDARALSRSLQYVESRRRGKQTQAYRAALQALGLTHERVMQAASVDRIR